MINKDQYEKVEKLILKLINTGKFEENEENLKILKDAKILEEHLYNEIMKGNLVMAYQPKFEPNAKQSKSAEALFRTNEEFFINPEVAFALFKMTGDHEKNVVDKQIEKICSDLSILTYNVDPNYCVSINVAMDLIDNNFCKNLFENLKKNGISSKNIEIELLEGENFDNIPQTTKQAIEKLQSNGINIALDDYGSANANENAFYKLDFDTLKLDKKIINSAHENDYDTIKKIHKMATQKNPNIKIIVEGVEHLEEVKKLQEIGNFSYQGWYFSKAISLEKIISDFGSKKTFS